MQDIQDKSKIISNQIAAVRREIAMRKSFYPRLVATGKKTQGSADYEIACMEEALNTLILAERSHLNKSFNQPADGWQPYPQNKPSSADEYQDFLVCYTSPNYIKKLGEYNRAPQYLYTVLNWTGQDFCNPDNLDICAFKTIPQF